MKQSIRFKLTLLFLATIIVPVVALVIALPVYYQKLITSQQSTLMEGTLSALSFDIETYLDDLERLTIAPYLSDDILKALNDKSSFRWQTMSPFEQWSADQQLYAVLPRYLTNVRQDILGTLLLPMDGSVYVSSPNGYTNQVMKNFPFEQQEWYQEAVKKDGGVAFISVHMQDYLQGGGTKVFSVARLLKDPFSGKRLGVMMADADTVALERIMHGIRLNSGAVAAILDDKGKLIYSSSPLSMQVQQQLAAGTPDIQVDNEKYSLITKTISRANWRTVVLLPESVVKAQFARIYWVGIAFAVSGLVIAFILYFTISHWMINPFKKMIHVMKRVQRGDLRTFYPVRGNDEIAQLGISLNTMISQLGELIDREFRAVLGQRNAEYRALQSQIHPHFLYNTLNGFIGLNRTGQSVLLERAILSLSSMLRYTLEHQDWVRLSEELDFIARYCELQRIRFPDRLHVQIDCEPDAGQVSIPKLLLQPIVENAIIHGIEPSDHSCELRIKAVVSIRTEDQGRACLEIEIADNGVGFEPSLERQGVGMTNVRERLRLAYAHAELTVDSGQGRGTRVRIEIPMKDVNRS